MPKKEKSGGSMTVDASVALVPQEAWIFNATLRENVLFGLEYDEVRYEEAIRVSCLDTDIAKMDFGVIEAPSEEINK